MAERKVALDSTRRTASEILDQVAKNAREELDRTPHALAFSGVAGGLTMGLTGIGVAVARVTLGPGSSADFISLMFYPLGFIAVIIGRAQLFTENTLYPVISVLENPRRIGVMLRLWGIVFASNVVGAFLFALLAERVPSLRSDYASELAKLGLEALANTPAHIFWSGVIGGWMIALVAWMVSASHWTIGQIAIVWMVTFLVGLGHFAHCIATSGEILSAVVAGQAATSNYFHWLFLATSGNIVGGVTIVSLLNYGQVHAGEEE